MSVGSLKQIIVDHNGAVGLLWNEEVMIVAYGYDYFGFQPHMGQPRPAALKLRSPDEITSAA